MLSATSSIIEFGFETANSNCNDASIVTLWFNYHIYQYIVTPSIDNEWFLGYKNSAPMFTELGLYECSPQNNNIETKLMIESNSGDDLSVDAIKMTTDTHWFGMDRFIIQGIDEGYACLSNDETDCTSEGTTGTGGIYKQMFYFNTTKPNEWITAQWSDAMDIYPELEIKTCEPTPSPTYNPTLNPSQNPTFNPTVVPTINPIFKPTFNPTYNPTDAYTPFPSMIPSKWSLFIPSNIPTLSSTKENKVYVMNTTFIQLGMVIIIVMVVLCLFCIGVVYCIYQRKRNQIMYVEDENTDNKDEILMIEWIKNTLKMSQYIDNFISNGYDAIRVILTLSHESELNDIGITNKDHQSHIITEINKLRNKTEIKCDNIHDKKLIGIASLSSLQQTEGVSNDADNDDDDDGLWEQQQTVNKETRGDVTVGTDTMRNMNICNDCGLTKHGSFDVSNGLFYCSDCWNYHI